MNFIATCLAALAWLMDSWRKYTEERHARVMERRRIAQEESLMPLKALQKLGFLPSDAVDPIVTSMPRYTKKQ